MIMNMIISTVFLVVVFVSISFAEVNVAAKSGRTLPLVEMILDGVMPNQGFKWPNLCTTQGVTNLGVHGPSGEPVLGVCTPRWACPRHFSQIPAHGSHCSRHLFDHVCCVETAGCGGSILSKVAYFSNDAFPNPSFGCHGNGGNCEVTVQKAQPNICQLKVSLLVSELSPPSRGLCADDWLLVSGHNGNFPIPPLCGNNTDHHIFVPVDQVANQIRITVRMQPKLDFPRRWLLLIEQLSCESRDLLAPEGCLKFYSSLSGSIKSFNHGPLFPNEHETGDDLEYVDEELMVDESQQVADMDRLPKALGSLSQNLAAHLEEMEANTASNIKHPLPLEIPQSGATVLINNQMVHVNSTNWEDILQELERMSKNNTTRHNLSPKPTTTTTTSTTVTTTPVSTTTLADVPIVKQEPPKRVRIEPGYTRAISYSMCIKRAPGHCGVQFSSTDFRLSNSGHVDMSVTDQFCLGSDFLQLPANSGASGYGGGWATPTRLCGNVFSGENGSRTPSPVMIYGGGPLLLQMVSRDLPEAKAPGFVLNYQQMPC